MKVGIIGPYPPPIGGIANYVIHTEKLLRNIGHRVGIINSGKNKEIICENVTNAKNSKDIFWGLMKADYTVVHINVAGRFHFNTFLAVSASLIFKNRSVIVTVHNSNFFNFYHHVGGWKKRLAKSGLNKINTIICVNNTIQRQAISTGVDPEKCIVIPAFMMQGVDIDEKIPEEMDAFIKQHSPLILTCGFFWPHRNDLYGFLDAINALNFIRKSHSSAGLIIAGYGSEKEKEPYVGLIDSLKLKDHVLIAGDLKNEVFLSILKQCHLFVRPTKDDADSISVREAMALDIPVVASATEYRPVGVITFPIGNYQEFLTNTLSILDGSLDKNSVRGNKKSFETELLSVYLNIGDKAVDR